jgi:hypothetical protein
MSDAAELSRRIDVIEGGYEYLLAYAAQGRQDDSGSTVRQTLVSMYEVLDGLAPLAISVVGAQTQGAGFEVAGFFDALRTDAHVARGAMGLVLSRPAISSLLVDNLNASVHLRALLTDLFLIEQALKAS